MKKQFEYGEIPHAQGRLISRIEELEGLSFPVIVKPRDNSGSRGVKYCRNRDELISSIAEALEFSRLDSVLVEEYIEGQEYSVESLHYNGKSEVIQFTEKKTTAFPYNVELGHKQPANLTYEQKKAILRIVQKIGEMLKFDNCPSHTELKINERGIFVIETSPRLGGDSITSTLVPLSTGINMEDLLINIAFFEPVDFFSSRTEGSSAIEFFQFKEGVVKYINPKIYGLAKESGVYSFNLKLKEGDLINKITSSLNRYGEFVVAASSRPKVEEIISLISERVNQYIAIE
jgi:carbamoyl-phosphate synthase large subunit